MPFFMGRGRTRARIGTLDTFERTVAENPPKLPWRRWGDGNAPAQITTDGRMILLDSSSYPFGPTGGWAIERQPLTDNYGYEWEQQLSARGSFSAYLDTNWTTGEGPGDQQTKLFIRFRHYSTTDSNDNTDHHYVAEIEATESGVQFFSNTPSFNFGSQANLLARRRVRLDVHRDRLVTVHETWPTPRTFLNYYLNGDQLGFRTFPNSRALNFRAYSLDATLYGTPQGGPGYHVFDYPPLAAGAPIFSDTFNGRTGNQNGVNGWTQFGNNAAVVADSFSTTGTTDGSRALLRNTGITNGRMRTVITLGGNINSTAGSAPVSAIVCANAAGTQGLLVDCMTDEFYIRRFSTVLSGNLPTVTDLAVMRNSLSVAAGMKLALEVYDGELRADLIDLTGQIYPVCKAINAHAVVPATNSYAGCRVSRRAFGNSMSVNDIEIQAM